MNQEGGLNGVQADGGMTIFKAADLAEAITMGLTLLVVLKARGTKPTRTPLRPGSDP
ncbi:hypothetical protein [Duganella sp. BuS-21]|uniref:hypothetical protein n=1 Tax=Duganella sp. BuS-21 TaxID=2943848 RepID=UPI0035A6BB22